MRLASQLTACLCFHSLISSPFSHYLLLAIPRRFFQNDKFLGESPIWAGLDVNIEPAWLFASVLGYGGVTPPETLH